MKKARLLAVAAVAAGALAAPAASQAQSIDASALCHTLIGSGTINLGVASADHCLAANEPAPCGFADTLDVLGLVRVKHGLCINVSQVLASRKVSVRGLATVRLLP